VHHLTDIEVGLSIEVIYQKGESKHAHIHQNEEYENQKRNYIFPKKIIHPNRSIPQQQENDHQLIGYNCPPHYVQTLVSNSEVVSFMGHIIIMVFPNLNTNKVNIIIFARKIL
jgi:hypothetical protein